jgi:hypothetical protein
MKKIIIISILAFIFIGSCFSQVIRREIFPYLHPLKDSVKVYENERINYFARYISKGDSLRFIKDTYAYIEPYEKMYVVSVYKNSCNCSVNGYVFAKESIISPGTFDTLTKQDIIGFLEEDTLQFNPCEFYTFEENISRLKEKYNLVCDDLTIGRIYSSFYKTKNIFELINTLKKNNIPLYLYKAEITLNIIGNPEVTVDVTNISKNEIDAFDIDVYCYNRYGQPVKKFSTGSNICYCTSQDVINVGSKQSGTWTLHGQELTTNVKVFLSKVHFTNGKTLVISNKQLTKIEGKLD